METPILISLSFESLLYEIQRTNQYRAKDLESSDGESLFDKYAIMVKDEPVIKGFIEDGMDEISDILIGYITGGAGVVTITSENVTITFEGAEGADTEAKNNLQRMMKAYLIEYSLKKWYETIGLPNDSKVSDLRMEEIKLKKAASKLRMSRWYNQ